MCAPSSAAIDLFSVLGVSAKDDQGTVRIWKDANWTGSDNPIHGDLTYVMAVAMAQADRALKQNLIKPANDIYQAALKMFPEDPDLLERLCRLWLKAGHAERAVRYAEQALRHAQGSSTKLQLLGEAYSAWGEGDKAIEFLEQALKACEKEHEGQSRKMELLLSLAKIFHAQYSALSLDLDLEDEEEDKDSSLSERRLNSQQGASTSAASSADGKQSVKHKTREATVTDKLGSRFTPGDSSSEPSVSTTDHCANDSAYQAKQNLLRIKAATTLDRCGLLVMELVLADKSNWDYLFMYATIALERGHLEDAIKVSLSLLVQRSKDSNVKALLAQCLMLSSSLDVMMAQIGGSSAAAMAYLANCVKDHGAVTAAVQLFLKAVLLEPSSSTYSLNYLHALELDQQYDLVVKEALRFCKDGSFRLGGDLTSLTSVVSELQSVCTLQHMTSLNWLRASAGHYDAKGDSPPRSVAGLSSATLKVAYSPDQLELLAILFTATKVLYVGGALHQAGRLCELVETARLASTVELHKTKIRNEAAYFGCIHRLSLQFKAPLTSEELNLKPLYLCGDSHCLSAAWRVVTLRGERRLIQPLLITGCKIWHLRPKSLFYPKLQFMNTMKKLKPGSQVVMLFGEIDCREGLLLAVQKCKYDSLSEGISHTVDIYVELLLELIQELDLELFVHPIAPVLKETRPVVIPFMSVLKSKVLKAATTPQARGQSHPSSRLHFLDFFDDLLVPGEVPALKSDLEFDGTHLSPEYIKILSSSLSAIK
ncbi:hypothetical protein CEUSTIGMA_g8177.t1 [Chlamydomonas eustigma]|uniref:Uncharacterized protein n=1 Tax=Chlamydomonas eustigma TaxID=1157962 RepID=A0A250XCX9_9CHLO|nr:hypothetical protein CEUSTIGMA_g8177.t1 [Chlamydomonas eustigma]|eukprot:GAX80742.1 hypothetical protein CEUSTIGMA_g8177.t1 [Chlamydomonas eustigma]